MIGAVKYAGMAIACVTGACLGTPARPLDRSDAASGLDATDANGSTVVFCPNPGAWGTPRFLSELGATGYNEGEPYLTPDGLDLWYATPDSLRHAHRGHRGDMFNPSTVVALGTHSNPNGPFLSDDQQTIWFTQYNVFGNPDYSIHLFTAPRTGAEQFGPETLAALDSMTSSQESPSLSSDALELALSLHDTGIDRLYIADRTIATVDFARPTIPLELGSAGFGARSPWLSGDGLVLFWSASNTLWSAARADRAGTFGTAVTVVIPDEGRPWRGDPALTRDGSILVYSAGPDPANMSTAVDLFIVERTCN